MKLSRNKFSKPIASNDFMDYMDYADKHQVEKQKNLLCKQKNCVFTDVGRSTKSFNDSAPKSLLHIDHKTSRFSKREIDTRKETVRRTPKSIITAKMFQKCRSLKYSLPNVKVVFAKKSYVI